mgnify:CR=1 FL=1
MAFKMKGFSPFTQKVKSETTRHTKTKGDKYKKTVTRHTSITPTSNEINPEDPTSRHASDIKSKNTTKSKRKGGTKVKYKRSILTTDPEENVTSTVTKSKRKGGTKVKTYKGKKAIRKHKRV